MLTMKCAECGAKVEFKSDPGPNVWTAFCSAEHCAKWQSERTEEEILRHQYGNCPPWSPYDRCQWCRATLKSGYHEGSCPVRKTQGSSGMKIHPSVQHVLQFFEYDHLPAHLQVISKPFADLAHKMSGSLEGPELTVCLRKLLESKDCAVRAALTKKKEDPGGSSSV
jgi:hypothetical protein